MKSPASPPQASLVRLADLPAGATARFHGAVIGGVDEALLRALGMTERSLVRVCKAGEPCIVQVRATRIGLSRELAAGVLVVPEEQP
jgi:Fe2+ transport system protein FeoA